MIDQWLEKKRRDNFESGAKSWRRYGYVYIGIGIALLLFAKWRLCLGLGCLFLGAGGQSLLAARHIDYWRNKGIQ